MTELDLMIETAAVQGQLSTGVPPSIVAARSALGKRGVAIFGGRIGSISASKAIKPKSPTWSKEEDKFLETHLGILKGKEIAEILGRSEMAVHLRWERDLGLPAPSKHPDFISGNQIAIGLCIDSHTTMKLIDNDILDGHLLPSSSGRKVRLVNRITLLRFIAKHFKHHLFTGAEYRLVRENHLPKLQVTV